MPERTTNQPESTRNPLSPEQAPQAAYVPDTTGDRLDMTPLSPQSADSPEVASQPSKPAYERLVFIHPKNNERQFDINPRPEYRNYDSREGAARAEREAVNAIYAMQNDREAAAAQTPEATQESKAAEAWLGYRSQMLVRVGRTGELNPEALDPSLN